MCAKCDKGWAKVGNSRFCLGNSSFILGILEFFLEILDFAQGILDFDLGILEFFLRILEFPSFYARKLDFFSLILGYLVIICAKIYF